MNQYDTILTAMINHKEKKTWTAKDFLKDPYFVGYEASPRMSELIKMYPELFITGKDGRYRTLEINWRCKDIKIYLKKYKEKNVLQKFIESHKWKNKMQN